MGFERDGLHDAQDVVGAVSFWQLFEQFLDADAFLFAPLRFLRGDCGEGFLAFQVDGGGLCFGVCGGDAFWGQRRPEDQVGVAEGFLGIGFGEPGAAQPFDDVVLELEQHGLREIFSFFADDLFPIESGRGFTQGGLGGRCDHAFVWVCAEGLVELSGQGGIDRVGESDAHAETHFVLGDGQGVGAIGRSGFGHFAQLLADIDHHDVRERIDEMQSVGECGIAFHSTEPDEDSCVPGGDLREAREQGEDQGDCCGGGGDDEPGHSVVKGDENTDQERDGAEDEDQDGEHVFSCDFHF